MQANGNIGDCYRNIRLILRFYNNTWLHFKLLKELVPQPRHMTKKRLFGVYLHALTVHAPPILEMISLKSINAEHEERLFGQAKDIAVSTTNRKPQTLLPNVLLRLQAKQKLNDVYSSLRHSYSEISKEAAGIKRFTSRNTRFTHTFVSNRTSSWQAHLIRISKYLQQGEGEWWNNVEECFEFLDGENVTKTPYRPCLAHFRETNLKKIEEESLKTWQEIISNDETNIPTQFIRLYDENGSYIGRKYYSDSSDVQDQSEEMDYDIILPGLTDNLDKPGDDCDSE